MKCHSAHRRLLTVTLTAASLLCVTAFLTAGAGSSRADSLPEERVRPAVLAGTWYPAEAQVLRGEVEAFLKAAPAPEASGRLVGLIAPHAGYRFSGAVAAHAYKWLEKQSFTTVVVLAPSHHARFPGVSVYDQGGFNTPLGTVPLDRDLVEALKARDGRIHNVAAAHAREHAVEIQLPFLQVVMPGVKLVPLVMGEQDESTCQWLAAALADCLGSRSALIVASSDLSHFHGDDEARRLDRVVQQDVERFDPVALHEHLAAGKAEACGGGPMVTAMLTARRLGANRASVLRYATSGDVTGERGRVVGYLAAALWEHPPQPSGDTPRPHAAGVDLGFSDADKARLRHIARESIEAQCLGRPTPRHDPLPARFLEPCGAFVTLHKNGALRGCIGHIVATRPLAETVADMAVAAAFHDPRFSPVTAGELKELDIEISVLTPLQRVTDPGEIQVGKHGLYIKRSGQAGLLLPQVAVEQGWERTTFLEETCRKARLPRDAWKDPASEIYIFSADVF